MVLRPAGRSREGARLSDRRTITEKLEALDREAREGIRAARAVVADPPFLLASSTLDAWKKNLRDVESRYYPQFRGYVDKYKSTGDPEWARKAVGLGEAVANALSELPAGSSAPTMRSYLASVASDLGELAGEVAGTVGDVAGSVVGGFFEGLGLTGVLFIGGIALAAYLYLREGAA